MKKLITVSSVIALLAGSSAFAKTEGNYFGVELLRGEVKHQYRTNGNFSQAFGHFADSDVTGYGINFKHAFNLGNNIFVAPGVFYDKLDSRATDRLGLGETISIESRYGAKFDIGFDVTDKAAIYFTNGVSKNRYLVDWSTGTGGGLEPRRSTTPFTYFYGAGAMYHASENVTLNVEYNTQGTSLKTQQVEVTGRAKINMMKFGIAYHF